MNRSSRIVALMLVFALPACAFARPPQIYHHTDTVAAHPGASLRVDLSSQDVVIAIKGGKTVAVTTNIWADADSDKAKARIVKRYAPTTKLNGKDVAVRGPEQHGWGWHWGSSPRVRVTIALPPNMDVNYHTGSGDVRFDNATAKTPIEGRGGSGDVFIKSASSRVSLTTGSGDVRLEVTGADSLRVHTGSGDVRLGGSTGSLAVETGSSDVTLTGVSAQSGSFQTGSGDLRVHWEKLVAGATLNTHTGSGDVVMHFPTGTTLGGHMEVGSGEVNSDFPMMAHGSHHSYTLSGGAGAVRANFKTGSGDVTLHMGG